MSAAKLRIRMDEQPEEVQQIFRECRIEDCARAVLADVLGNLGTNPFVQQPLRFVMEYYQDLKVIEEAFRVSLGYNPDLSQTLSWVQATRKSIHDDMEYHLIRLQAVLRLHPKYDLSGYH